MRYSPGGTRSFDFNLLAVMSASKGLLNDDDIYSDSLPITTMDTLSEAMEERAQNVLRQSQITIVKSLVQNCLVIGPPELEKSSLAYNHLTTMLIK